MEPQDFMTIMSVTNTIMCCLATFSFVAQMIQRTTDRSTDNPSTEGNVHKHYHFESLCDDVSMGMQTDDGQTALNSILSTDLDDTTENRPPPPRPVLKRITKKNMHDWDS